MDYSSYMETTIFRTAAMLGFRRLKSYMLPCLYALLPFTSMYNSGDATPDFADPSTLDSVSHVLLNGKGRKNTLPLQAFNELYTGTSQVYVPSLTTV